MVLCDLRHEDFAATYIPRDNVSQKRELETFWRLGGLWRPKESFLRLLEAQRDLRRLPKIPGDFRRPEKT